MSLSQDYYGVLQEERKQSKQMVFSFCKHDKGTSGQIYHYFLGGEFLSIKCFELKVSVLHFLMKPKKYRFMKHSFLVNVT